MCWEYALSAIVSILLMLVLMIGHERTPNYTNRDVLNNWIDRDFSEERRAGRNR